MSKSVFDKKLSPILSDFLPEFVRADHPKFVRFLKDYFKFLESAELTISGTVNYVAQETISKNYVLDENGDNIVLQDSVSKFTVDDGNIDLSNLIISLLLKLSILLSRAFITFCAPSKTLAFPLKILFFSILKMPCQFLTKITKIKT